MRLLNEVRFLLHISSSHGIARRYFVVNGFDGALTMLGLIIGFALSTSAELSTVMNACLGAAIALGMSGLSSAYISETAERKHALDMLEQAMARDLQHSAHGKAARLVPWIIALVNGLAPLAISLLILMPLWLANAGVQLPLSPLYAAILVALALVFLLGVFLGRIAEISWLRSGLHTLIMAVLTAALIYLFVGLF
ncbi:MAG: putative membrane protein (TIGR00267 family) [Gammaproteobacteria bacterium]|jgi:predicted membrane protein (TIGR00267 family)